MSGERRSHFRAKELAIVLSHYDIGIIEKIHRFQRGNVKSPKLQIISEKGQFLLKRRPLGHDDPYRVALAHDLQLYLASKGFCAPRLIGTHPSNSSMLQAQSAMYELFEFVEGEPYDQSIESTDSAGHHLRWFHDLLRDYSPAYEATAKSYHNSTSVQQNIQRTAVTISSHDSVAGSLQAELQGLTVSLLDAYTAAAETVDRLSDKGKAAIICHGDWHPANLIFRDKKVVAVLDYESACRMDGLADVAVGCLQFSMLVNGAGPDNWPAQFDSARAKAFIGGYKKREEWTEDELAILCALMVEALIAEAVGPIAATGMFANVHGFRFLRMIGRKVEWLSEHGLDSLKGEG